MTAPQNNNIMAAHPQCILAVLRYTVPLWQRQGACAALRKLHHVLPAHVSLLLLWLKERQRNCNNKQHMYIWYTL
jgi:hypothetical protein